MKLLSLLVLWSLSPHLIHSLMICLSPPYPKLKNAMLTTVPGNFSFSSFLNSFFPLRQVFLLLEKHLKVSHITSSEHCPQHRFCDAKKHCFPKFKTKPKQILSFPVPTVRHVHNITKLQFGEEKNIFLIF